MVGFVGRLLSDGTKASFGRASCAVVLFFLLMWTTYVVSKTGVIPDIPLQWAMLATLLFLGGKALDLKKPQGDTP